MEFDRDLDVKGLNCPLPILRTKKTLAEMETGQVLRVQATRGGKAREHLLIGLCNKPAKFGHLANQISKFAKQAANEAIAQCVR